MFARRSRSAAGLVGLDAWADVTGARTPCPAVTFMAGQCGRRSGEARGAWTMVKGALSSWSEASRGCGAAVLRGLTASGGDPAEERRPRFDHGENDASGAVAGGEYGGVEMTGNQDSMAGGRFSSHSGVPICQSGGSGGGSGGEPVVAGRCFCVEEVWGEEEEQTKNDALVRRVATADKWPKRNASRAVHEGFRH
jgi:hypothetical protein